MQELHEKLINMNTLTKNFLKFIANNKGLLDKETLDIIVTENIIIHLKKDEYELELLGCNRFIESNELISLNYDDCRYEFSANFKKLFINSLFTDTSKISYSEQLKHDLWKQKRNHIVAQRGNKCERCKNTENLQVHHIKYIKGRLAWEYSDDLLECLCGSCHMKEHDVNKSKADQAEKWIQHNSLSIEESKQISNNKKFVLSCFKNEVVNKIVNTFELYSSSPNAIRFKVSNKNYYAYLHKLFGDVILNGDNSIGFHLNIMKKKK